MFYPQEMTEVQLIIPARDLLAVTRSLADQGTFHQVDGSYLSSEKEANPAESWTEKASAYSAFERRVLNLMLLLGMADEGQQPSSWMDLADPAKTQALIEGIENDVKEVNDRVANEQKQLDKLKNTVLQLEPVSGLEVEVSELCCPHFTFSLLGLMPTANIERLETSLGRVPYVLVTLRKEGDRSVVWLAGTRRNADILDRAARSLDDGQHGVQTEAGASLTLGRKKSLEDSV